MTAKRESLSDRLCHETITRIDSETLEAGLSLRAAAQLYRELASECRDRAAGLDEEADANEAADEQ